MTFLLLLTLLQTSDTIDVDYGDPNFFTYPDSIAYQIRTDLNDGFYRAYGTLRNGEKYLRFSGALLDHQRTGSWRFYTQPQYAQGSYLQHEEVFDQGDWVETTSYYENGKKEDRLIYAPKSKHQSDWTEMRRWHRNGQLSIRVFIPEGASRYKQEGYYETGELHYEGYFDRHERTTGTWTYFHKNGTIAKQGKYCNKCLNKGVRAIFYGIPRGTWNYYDEQGNLIQSKKQRHR